MTLLTIDPSLPLVWKDGRDLVLLSKDDADPGPWALAVARAVFWQVQGQWTFDLKKGIDYPRILGEFSDRRYCEEQMRRGLAVYFTILRLSVREEINASNGQPDLIVEFSARIRDQIVVAAAVSFLEGTVDPSVSLLSASYDDATLRIGLHFSRALSPDYAPALEDWKLIGFVGSPTITAVAMNGEQVWLTVSASLEETGGAPSALLYTPTGEDMRATNGARVLPFRVPLSVSQAFLFTDTGEPLVTDTGEEIYA